MGLTNPFIELPERLPKRDRRIVAQPRWMRPDLTGFYEAQPRGANYAPLLVQLNQAGNTLVGWVVPPPTNVPMRTPVCFSDNNPRLNTRLWTDNLVGLVFVGDRGSPDPIDGSIRLHAGAVSLASTYAPSDVWYLAADPSMVLNLLLSDPEKRLVHGRLRTSTRSLPNHIQVTVQVTFNDSPDGWETLTQLNSMPRIPGAHGARTFDGSFSTEPFRSWAATHSRPLPSRFLNEIAARIALDAKPRDDISTGELGQAIQSWYLSDKALRAEKREQVFKPLRTWLDNTPGCKGVYGPPARSALLRALASNVCKVKDSTGMVHGKTYRDWLTIAYGEEVDHWRRTGQRTNDLNVPRMGEVGLGAGDFIYTFTFSRPGDIAVPKTVLKKLPAPVAEALKKLSGYTRYSGNGVTLGINVFYANVKKEQVNLKLDPEGKPAVKADGTFDATRVGATPAFDTSRDKLSGLIGVYVDMGAGFPVPGVHFTSLEMLSAIGTLTKDSFNHSVFEVGQVSTPSVPAVGAKGPVSVMFSISKDTPEEHLALSTVFETPAATPKSISDLAKIFQKWQLELSFGNAVGYFVSGAQGTTETKPEPVPVKPAASAEVAVALRDNNFFAVGKHEIPPTPGYIGPFSRRNVLETCYAEYCCLAINPTATRASYGWASPEYDSIYNLELSQDRARALAKAYLDSFEPGLVTPFADENIIGYGEGPSLSHLLFPEQPPLQNPEEAIRMSSASPGYSVALENWKRHHPDQVKIWFMWRRAELMIDGLVVVSVGAGEQK